MATWRKYPQIVPPDAVAKQAGRACLGRQSFSPPMSCSPTARPSRSPAPSLGGKLLATNPQTVVRGRGTPLVPVRRTVTDSRADSQRGVQLGRGPVYHDPWACNALGEPKSKAALDTATGTYSSTAYGYSSTALTELTSAATTGAAISSIRHVSFWD
jgi:hypothetical protein